MKSLSRYFQTANAVFTWLWALSFPFSIWMAIGFASWFLPYHTVWSNYIKHHSLFYLLIGCLLHLLTIVSQQQVLFIRDFPSNPHTNLTFTTFIRKTGWLFTWHFPYYILTGTIILYRYPLLPMLRERIPFSPLLSILTVLVVTLFILLLFSVHSIGACFLFRHPVKSKGFFLFSVWKQSMKSLFSHVSLWGGTYSLMSGLFLLMILILWSYWTIWNGLQTKPVWDLFYPESWLWSFVFACIGIESFFFPLLSIASAESNQLNPDV